MNEAALKCYSPTGVCVLSAEYPTVVEARRAGQKLVIKGKAATFRVFAREAVDGEIKLTRQTPNSAAGLRDMRGTRGVVRDLRAGTKGVRVPGHVGTWTVSDTFEATDRNGETVRLATVEHERIASVRLVVDRSTRRVYAIIRPGWKDTMKEKEGIVVL